MNFTDPNCRESLLAQFASLWQSGGMPDVFVFLKAHTGVKPRECLDVLLCDLFHRWQADMPLRVEEYLTAFPAVAADERLAVELIAEEFGQREYHGQEPTLEEYAQRFPQLRDALSLQLDEPGKLEAEPAEELAEQHARSAETGVHANDATRSDLVASTIAGGTSRSGESPSAQPSSMAFQHGEAASLFSLCEGMLASYMHEKRYSKGDLLWRQGDEGDSLIVLAGGVVRISTRDDAGREHFIRRVGQGDVIGEMALLNSGPRTADAAALSDVRALVLPADTFHMLAKKNPTISMLLTRLVAKRLGRQDRDVLAGKTYGGYHILQRLDRGGMAVVYEGVQVETGQHVALKMMSHNLVYDERARTQFQQEADMIESFDHENICGMVGRFDAFHTCFIAMEFCEGVPLKRVLENGPLPTDQVRRIIGQVISAIRYAHNAGVVHRDIKPSNIMLNPCGAAKLMDFGLAWPLEDPANDQDGSIVGTPRYMAPEQAAGDVVSYGADLFSLGAVMHEMITGEPLFNAKDTYGMLTERMTWDPPNFADQFPELEEDLCQFMQQCLNLDPVERQPDLTAAESWAGEFDAGVILEQPQE